MATVDAFRFCKRIIKWDAFSIFIILINSHEEVKSFSKNESSLINSEYCGLKFYFYFLFKIVNQLSIIT